MSEPKVPHIGMFNLPPGFTAAVPYSPSVDLFEVNKVAIRVPMSYAVLYGFNQERDLYQMAVDREQWRAEKAAREVAKDRLWEALWANAQSVAEMRVLQLHEPVFSSWDRQGEGVCEGCDLDGYEVEPPPWPCSTLRVMAEAYRLQALYEAATA